MIANVVRIWFYGYNATDSVFIEVAVATSKLWYSCALPEVGLARRELPSGFAERRLTVLAAAARITISHCY
jgi:hypothetical protein